ncbi:MAG: PAS domain-containing sensor histidine kinase [Candidatus Sumerlaeota bacterium]|nr:PAS domain-containing sensor histidine kinase [Candidatus Sumerlaeota bacterium]
MTYYIYSILIALLAIQVVLLAQVIRGRMRATKALRAGKEFAENLIESCSDMIIASDSQRRIVLFNTAAEAVFGFSRQEAIGKDVNTLYAKPEEAEEVRRCLSEKGAFTGEILNIRKNGETFPSFLCASVLRDSAGAPIGAMGTSRDITAQKQMQAEKERLSRMKDEFMAIASHDLKSPLGSIGGYAQLLLKLTPPGSAMTDETCGFVERIKILAGVMNKIVEDYVDFYALQDGKMRLSLANEDLNAIAQEIVENSLQSARSKGIELIFESSSELPRVQADGARIEQVIENLVSNAIKFCGRGCKVYVSTRAEQGGVALSVSDNGPGLKDEDASKVFVKYARLSNRPTGGEKSSGLGLAICRELIELHGGQIGVHNNPSGGATFWFRLQTDHRHQSIASSSASV